MLSNLFSKAKDMTTINEEVENEKSYISQNQDPANIPNFDGEEEDDIEKRSYNHILPSQ